MKKLHSLAFYALVTPTMVLGSSALLAAQPDEDAAEVKMQNETTPLDQGAEKQSTPGTMKNDKQMGSSSMQSEDYMSSAPADGMHASELIGSDVKTTGDEEIGAVSDLIIDQDGKVAAIVVGVGGFLGMGEKDVAIAWDNVTRSGTSDDQELRIDATRDELQSAPEFEMKE